jgi:hypothetical protein
MRFSVLVARCSCAFLAGTALLGCRSASAPAGHGDSPKPQAASPAPARETQRFGAPITPGDALPLGRVLEKPDAYSGKTVIVEAKVRRNCTRRGCWMELADGLDPTLPGCRVTFKDYGFFVPLDSAGSTARVQGDVEVETVAAPEVAHLESEGARFPSKQADGTAREVRMVATGVELSRGSG